MLDFIKKYKKIMIASVIISPVVIYLLLWIPIPTNTSTDGDWLSFWGSFLGGLFGGIATLMAVLLTIEEMNKERNDRKLKEEAIIIPITSEYQINHIHKNYEQKYTIVNFKDQSWNDKYDEYLGSEDCKKALEMSNELSPSFEVLNISNNIAINVSIEWKKPSIKEINSVLLENSKITIEEYEKLKENKPFKIQLIKGEESYKNIYLHKEIQKCICILLDKYNKCIEQEGYKNQNFPVGQFEITNTNIYGKEHKDYINMTMYINASATDEYYCFYLNYSIIK